MGAEAHRPPPVAEASVAAADEPRARRQRRLWPYVLVVVLVLAVARIYFVEPFKTDGPSMLPTLHSGDQVLVDKRAYRDALPRRGDLVVFHRPRSGEVTLKRVVAVPGDTVGIEDGVLVVDGRHQTESYADPDAIDSVYFGPVRVRPGTVFVLGDNRADSIDSRDFGAVTKGELIGRVRGLFWPPSRW
ncbi:MAG TPA: signal peptidase I [Solirubrobacteraceae bacterium]|jgi:signal peptidase I|nr:signal peptidase I [Solirubrobacteraceae bacterium]